MKRVASKSLTFALSRKRNVRAIVTRLSLFGALHATLLDLSNWKHASYLEKLDYSLVLRW